MKISVELGGCFFGSETGLHTRYVHIFKTRDELKEWESGNPYRQELEKRHALWLLEDYQQHTNYPVEIGKEHPTKKYISSSGHTYPMNLDEFLGSAKNDFIDRLNKIDAQSASLFDIAVSQSIGESVRKGKAEIPIIHFRLNPELYVAVANDVGTYCYARGSMSDYSQFMVSTFNLMKDCLYSCKDKDSNINSYFLSAIEDCTRKNKAERVTISFYFDEKQNKPKAVISDDIGAHDYCDVHVSEYMDFLATKLRLVAKSLREANCTTDPQASLSRIIQSVTNSLCVAFQCYGASKKITKDYVASVLNKKIINVLMSDDFSFKNVKKAELLSDWFDAYNFGLFETREERANCEVLLKSNTLINKMLSISELLLSNRNFENKDIDKSLNKGMIYLLNEIDDFYFTRHGKILRKASDRLLHFWSDCTSDGGISSIKSNINIELEIRSVLIVLETSMPQEATPSQAVKHKKSRLRI